MTDEELAAIERLLATDWTPTVGGEREEACRRLLPEVRRLRGLIRRGEHAAGDEYEECAWCWIHICAPGARHADDCPAFTPDGEVK